MAICCCSHRRIHPWEKLPPPDPPAGATSPQYICTRLQWSGDAAEHEDVVISVPRDKEEEVVGTELVVEEKGEG